MMNTVDHNFLMELVAQSKAPCVSVCLPVSRVAPESDENRIRYKNLLKQAEEQLDARGMRSRDTAAFLQPMTNLIDGGRLRQPRGDGLAVLHSPESFHCIDLPYSCEAVAVAGERLHVKPLVPLVSNGRFFVLALAQNEARLYEGAFESFSERESADLPAGLTEPTPEAEEGRPLQFHTGTQPAGRARAAAFHAQDTEAATGDERVMRYLREINGAVCKSLAGERAPLVLAAVDDLAVKYAMVNGYANLLDEPISGNPERTHPDDLRRMAWERVKPALMAERNDAIARYHQALSKAMGSNDPSNIVEVAFHGKVDTLMVALDRQHWGRFDEGSGRAQSDAQRAPDSEDLLNVAAAFALQHGGTVHALRSEDMPEQRSAAAIFRK